MKTKYIQIHKTSSFGIGQQGDHKALQIRFTDIDYLGDLYIKLEIEDYTNMILLTDDTFIVGKPLTTYFGEVKAQLYSKLLDSDEYEELSHVFTMIISESIGYVNVSDYPIDPNIQIIYDRVQKAEQDAIKATTDCNSQTQKTIEATSRCNKATEDSVNATSESKKATEEANNAASSAIQAEESFQSMMTQGNQLIEDLSSVDVAELIPKINSLLEWQNKAIEEINQLKDKDYDFMEVEDEKN